MEQIKEKIYIGIDTGVNTGIAVWNKSRKCFLKIETVKIHVAIRYVLAYANSDRYELVRVRVEDARKRSMAKNHPQYYAQMQGAGSVKRDAVVWEDMLVDLAIPHEMVAPQSNTTKVTQESFRQMTGLYVKSDHSRDAAMLVIGL